MENNKNIPISDNHMHIWRMLPMEETVAFHREILENYGYSSITLLAVNEVPNPSSTKSGMPNLKVMYVKEKLYPRVYAHASLHLKNGDVKSTSEELLSQAKMYYDAGFDGIKMFYNAYMYEVGYPPLSYRIYEPFFQFMEEKGFPIVLHLGEAELCWRDPELIPPTQRKWRITNTYVHLYDIFRDFLTVMDRHPKLKMVLAHFGSVTEHPDWAGQWLDKYENLYFDLTPSPFIYYDFQKNKEVWTEFFTKYQDRILYGTDIGSNTLDVEKKEPDALVHLVKGFFTETEPIFELGEEFSPMPLPEPILRKIFRENMLRLYDGDPPRPLCKEALYPEFQWEDTFGIHSPLLEENLREIKKTFGYPLQEDPEK